MAVIGDSGCARISSENEKFCLLFATHFYDSIWGEGGVSTAILRGHDCHDSVHQRRKHVKTDGEWFTAWVSYAPAWFAGDVTAVVCGGGRLLGAPAETSARR